MKINFIKNNSNNGYIYLDYKGDKKLKEDINSALKRFKDKK